MDHNNHVNFFSNYIVANVRSISGSAVEKFPENNHAVLDAAFSYRMIVENNEYLPFATRHQFNPDYTRINDPAAVFHPGQYFERR